MTSHEQGPNDVRYEVMYEFEPDGAEGARRRAAIQKTHSLLAQWRGRFTGETIDPQQNKAKNVTLSSVSPVDAVAEITAVNGVRLKHELSGDEGNLVVTEYPHDGEPRVIAGDFVAQHDDLARIIFDFDREIARG